MINSIEHQSARDFHLVHGQRESDPDFFLGELREDMIQKLFAAGIRDVEFSFDLEEGDRTVLVINCKEDVKEAIRHCLPEEIAAFWQVQGRLTIPLARIEDDKNVLLYKEDEMKEMLMEVVKAIVLEENPRAFTMTK
jgi:hypothetical protein